MRLYAHFKHFVKTQKLGTAPVSLLTALVRYLNQLFELK